MVELRVDREAYQNVKWVLCVGGECNSLREAGTSQTHNVSQPDEHWTDICNTTWGSRHLPWTLQALSCKTTRLRIYIRCIHSLVIWMLKHPHPSHSRPKQQLTAKLYCALVEDMGLWVWVLIGGGNNTWTPKLGSQGPICNWYWT